LLVFIVLAGLGLLFVIVAGIVTAIIGATNFLGG